MSDGSGSGDGASSGASSGCPWRKTWIGEDVFASDWQETANKSETSGCDPLKTEDGRFLPLPAPRLCRDGYKPAPSSSSSPASCFNAASTEAVKQRISRKCVGICKRSNYEEEFSLIFDHMTEEEIKMTYFDGQELDNKTSIRTEMRYSTMGAKTT